MEKYNSLLGKNMNSKEKLEHKIFDVEIQFKEKLKQLENESVKLELEIEVLREEKSDTLTQILEVERQIHLWERKIQLEEKMQEIIKPDKGLKEIDKIKTELHVQDLKYKKLKQDQEKVIKSMEMAIQRRDFIKIRYPGDKSTSKVVSGVTTMKKQIDDLRDHLKHLENKTKQNTSLVQTTRKELNKVNSDLESINIEVKRMQDNISQCKDEFAINKILANNFAFNAKYLQDATKDIEDIQKKKIRNRDTVLKETENIVSETEMLKNILINFSNTNPEYEEIINVALEIDKI
jgi:chromosome segregation ATPase